MTAGTRVLKPHTEAVKAVINDALALLPDTDAMAHSIAEAVLTATDNEVTRYVIGTRTHDAMTVIYGPYATHAAASKAASSGAAVLEPNHVGIYPLVPSPKLPRQRKKAKK